MLANGAKLGYKKKGAGEDYTNLTGLKEIPELGDDPEKVENTGLADKVKQYEFGIGDAGDLTYKFKYENTDYCGGGNYLHTHLSDHRIHQRGGIPEEDPNRFAGVGTLSGDLHHCILCIYLICGN